MNPLGNASNEKEFAGRRVLVTGGSRGMGRAIADLLTRAGASVVTTARSMPADGAPAGAFLASDRASSLTGGEYVADGGNIPAI